VGKIVKKIGAMHVAGGILSSKASRNYMQKSIVTYGY